MSENDKSNAAAAQPTAPSTPAPNTATAPQAPAPGRRRRDDAPTDGETHKVKKGETLEEIAEAHKTTAAELQRVNGIKRPELIWPGMELRFR